MMLVVTVHVNAPPGQAIGVKEQIAQDLERYGDTRVVSVEVVQSPQPVFRQMQIGGMDDRSTRKKQ